MSAKISVRLASEIANHPLPSKILLNQQPTEPLAHVLLKLLAYVLFQRDRLQVEPRLHDDNIPYIPDLLQLDLELRPALWIECGETEVTKLDRLAVKAPFAEIWAVQESRERLAALHREMSRHQLRTQRYHLLGFEQDLFSEMLATLAPRNELTLFRFSLDEPLFQLDFNGLWFEGTFEHRFF